MFLIGIGLHLIRTVCLTAWAMSLLGSSVKLVCTSECPFSVIFRARSRERSQRHFRAHFWVGVASRCVWQWKLNLELRSSTNATTVAVAKITGERGWRVEKNVFAPFFGWPEDREFVRKMRLGHPIARATLTSYFLLPDTFWLRVFKKFGNVKFARSLSPPFVEKKIRTGSKSSQGT